MKKLFTFFLIGTASTAFAQIPYSSKPMDANLERYRPLFHREQALALVITPSFKNFGEIVLDGMPVLKLAETDSEMVMWMKSPEKMPNPLLN